MYTEPDSVEVKFARPLPCARRFSDGEICGADTDKGLAYADWPGLHVPGAWVMQPLCNECLIDLARNK